MNSQLTPSRRAAVDALLNQNRETIAAGGSGRLIFALDATASRQPTWDTATELQAAMFAEAARLGGLQVQLVFFRGTECKATAWTTSPNDLAVKMRKITWESAPPAKRAANAPPPINTIDSRTRTSDAPMASVFHDLRCHAVSAAHKTIAPAKSSNPPRE